MWRSPDALRKCATIFCRWAKFKYGKTITYNFEYATFFDNYDPSTIEELAKKERIRRKDRQRE